MRHGKKLNHLGRTSSHRDAMLANMASSLILHKKISTTVAKAKALRKYVEPLLTKSKEDSTHSRRTVFSYLQNKDAVTTLFRDIAVKIADRPGGYTRILKTGNRLGDNAEMCLIELVDYNENMLGGGKAKKAAKTVRRRGGAKKKAVTGELPEAEVVTDAPEATGTDAPKSETPSETPAKKTRKKSSKDENKEEGSAE